MADPFFADDDIKDINIIVIQELYINSNKNINYSS